MYEIDYVFDSDLVEEKYEEFDGRDFTSEAIDISIELRIFKQDFEPSIKMKEIEGDAE